LTTRASPSHPFDLHVSCTPPALILSQDQTLRKNAQPCGCDFVRGFDRSHIRVFLDLCHSSVVKVQPTPKHAGVFGAEREVWGFRAPASNAPEVPPPVPSGARPR